GVGVHEGGVGRDGPAHGLRAHRQVDDDDAVQRGGLADADVFLRLHGDVGEGDELGRDPQAGERERLAHGDGGVGRRHGERRLAVRSPLERRGRRRRRVVSRDTPNQEKRMRREIG
ncbi:hypothetical protein DKP78_16430, partial [Enterococcus faecium]